MASFAESTYLRGSDGGVAAVEHNRLVVNPKTEFDQALADGLAFSWSTLTANLAAGNTLLGVENNSTDYLLCIEKIIISITVAGGSVCPVFTASGVTMAGTACNGVSLNRGMTGRNAAPLATAKSHETGQDEAAGSWTKKVYMPQCLTSVPYIINVRGGIRLPYDHGVFVDAIEEITAETVTIIGYFVPI